MGLRKAVQRQDDFGQLQSFKIKKKTFYIGFRTTLTVKMILGHSGSVKYLYLSLSMSTWHTPIYKSLYCSQISSTFTSIAPSSPLISLPATIHLILCSCGHSTKTGRVCGLKSCDQGVTQRRTTALPGGGTSSGSLSSQRHRPQYPPPALTGAKPSNNYHIWARIVKLGEGGSQTRRETDTKTRQTKSLEDQTYQRDSQEWHACARGSMPVCDQCLMCVCVFVSPP